MGNNLSDFKINLWVFECDDFLDDIVGVLINNELSEVLDYLVNKPLLLLSTSALETGLHDAASLLVASNLQTIVNHCFVNWLFVCWSQQNFEACLHDMVAVDVY